MVVIESVDHKEKGTVMVSFDGPRIWKEIYVHHVHDHFLPNAFSACE